VGGALGDPVGDGEPEVRFGDADPEGSGFGVELIAYVPGAGCAGKMAD
jgi:hypothetical protein